MTARFAPPFAQASASFAPADVQTQVALFLAREAEAADDRDYATWLGLVEDDYTYRVPVPRTPDSPFSPHYDSRSLLIDESKWSLEAQWFRRFEPEVYEVAWSDNPPIRFRHFVTNIRVRQTPSPDVLDVRSNVLLVGTRQSDAPKYISGERTDVVNIHADGYRLAHRWVVLDQVVIDFPQLRILL